MSPSPGLRAGTVMLTEIVGNVIILTDFERIESHHRREPLSVSSQRPQPPGAASNLHGTTCFYYVNRGNFTHASVPQPADQPGAPSTGNELHSGHPDNASLP